MRKGLDIPQVTVGTALIVTFFLFAIFYSQYFSGTVSANLAIEQKKIQVVDMAHLVKGCVSEEGLVLESLLTDERIDECNFPWLVFIEIKTRKGKSIGYAKEAVDARKRRQLSKVALTYIKANDCWHMRSRFDVVAINFNNNKREIEIIKDAFELAY